MSQKNITMILIKSEKIFYIKIFIIKKSAMVLAYQVSEAQLIQKLTLIILIMI